MKRVRFETPPKPLHFSVMNEFECQSPRPFIEKKVIPLAPFSKSNLFDVSNDPIQRYETANSSPYPTVNRTSLSVLSETNSKWSPSKDLDLSILDSSRQVPFHNGMHQSNDCLYSSEVKALKSRTSGSLAHASPRALSSLENKLPHPHNVLKKHDDFFLRRDNLRNLQGPMQTINQQFKQMSLDKENNLRVSKRELVQAPFTSKPHMPMDKVNKVTSMDIVAVQNLCKCHHCYRADIPTKPCSMTSEVCTPCSHSSNLPNYKTYPCHQHRISKQTITRCSCSAPNCDDSYEKCLCTNSNSSVQIKNKNMVDKKTWALKKYEESIGSSTSDIEKHGKLKEKREPTVADLFKIIKLQNEQLQLLQEKVDEFITVSKFEQQKQLPLQSNYLTEHVSVESVDTQCHKMSIGVMTSFEVVRTSTIINKEIVKQSTEAQIQCNRSQISVKETAQSNNVNFLDGIAPIVKHGVLNNKNVSFCEKNNMVHLTEDTCKDNMNEDKTLNELSLYNLQVANAITPLMSPDQSLYLDVRDYSDSGSECEDQSNVGWTYYNKVMTHVNGMLHDSDMPSSASAMYRNTRQQCMQMKIDKTNVSVIKRVKFGEDPVGIQQHVASTDTSLKMNQLAAKYLKNGTLPVQQTLQKPAAAPIDVSLATRNYMEKHQLLHGIRSQPIQTVDIPRFLDITALKQQPKLL